MLTGDIYPTSGDAFLDSKRYVASLSKEKTTVQSSLDISMFTQTTEISKKCSGPRTFTVELQLLEHLLLVYHGCFELVLEKSPIAVDLDIYIFYILKMV